MKPLQFTTEPHWLKRAAEWSAVYFVFSLAAAVAVGKFLKRRFEGEHTK